MIYYCQTEGGNFGDDLNPWLWSRLAPEIAGDSSPARLFLGIGTILTDKVPCRPVKVVFGSGYAYGRPPRLDAQWKVYCLRGPLTAQILGLPAEAAVTDPAILVRGFAPPKVAPKHPVAFMPHHQSFRHADWVALCREAGLHCIDPRQSVDRVLEELGATGLLLTEAMHGAIVADALRIPWVPVRIYPHFSERKWRDWGMSLQMKLEIPKIDAIDEGTWRSARTWEYAVKKLAASAGLGKPKWRGFGYGPTSRRRRTEILTQLARLARTEGRLSTDSRLNQAETRLMELFHVLRRDWATGALRPDAYRPAR